MRLTSRTIGRLMQRINHFSFSPLIHILPHLGMICPVSLADFKSNPPRALYPSIFWDESFPIEQSRRWERVTSHHQWWQDYLGKGRVDNDTWERRSLGMMKLTGTLSHHDMIRRPSFLRLLPSCNKYGEPWFCPHRSSEHDCTIRTRARVD